LKFILKPYDRIFGLVFISVLLSLNEDVVCSCIKKKNEVI
jgi:hypothetical protein